MNVTAWNGSLRQSLQHIRMWNWRDRKPHVPWHPEMQPVPNWLLHERRQAAGIWKIILSGISCGLRLREVFWPFMKKVNDLSTPENHFWKLGISISWRCEWRCYRRMRFVLLTACVFCSISGAVKDRLKPGLPVWSNRAGL